MAHVAGSRLSIASGIIPASLTPMQADGSADVETLAAHCQSLLEQGCTSVVVLGTTGEANSFTTAERQAILEGVVAAGVAPGRLIVGTGCCAAGDTVALTRHALSLGVARVLVLPPFYYKGVSDDGLYAAFATTIEQVKDDRLRFFVYSIPQLTGIQIGPGLIERLHAAYPTNVAGLKDSSGDWSSTETLCRRFGAVIDVLVGTEVLLRRAMAEGASGCITAIGNATAHRIVQLFRERDKPGATSLETSVNVTRAAFESYPMIPALKAYLAHATANKSWNNVRPPLRALSADQTQALMRALA